MKLDEIKKEPQDYKIYVDLDGVLVDFAKKAADVMGIPVAEFPSNNAPRNKEFDKRLWKAVRQHTKSGNKFWEDMEQMPDAMKLWNYVKKYDPEILTATGSLSVAPEEKKEWVKKHLGSDVVVHLSEHSRGKAEYAAPNHILIDDRKKSIEPWTAAGGIGILHTSAANTIKQLKKLGL